MAETITEKDVELTLTGTDGSISKVIGKSIKTDHGVLDKDGNPKISVNVIVPTANLIAKPGEVS